MKKYFILILPILILNSCQIEEAQEFSEIKVVNSLLSDPISKDFFFTINKIQNSSWNFNGSQEVFTNSRISEFKSINEFKSFVLGNFDNPEETFASLYEFALFSEKITKKYPEVLSLTNTGLETIINEYNKNYPNSGREIFGSNLRIQDQCSDQLDSSLSTCNQVRAIGAITCGLSVATVLGAFGCAAGVIALDATCRNGAWNSFNICLRFN